MRSYFRYKYISTERKREVENVVFPDIRTSPPAKRNRLDSRFRGNDEKCQQQNASPSFVGERYEIDAGSVELSRSVGGQRVVVEVLFNEIQASPQYESGLALRFARITRLREDKGPEDADTLRTLRTLFDRQFAQKGRLQQTQAD